jgi:hypothetical protein
VYFQVYSVRPTPSSGRYGVVDGAYVSMWIDEDDEAAADRAARTFLAANGWAVEERDHGFAISDDHYAPSQPQASRVHEAREHGVSAVFHEWDLEAPES